MKKYLFFLLLSLCLPSSLYAEEKNLHIGIASGYPPFYFFDSNQKPVGICIDVINHVAKQLNISVQYSSYPWKRMIRNGQEGYVDAIMPLFKTPEREIFLIFPENDIIMEDNSFFTLSSNPLTYSGNLNDVIDHRIGVIDSYSYGEEFDKKNIQHKTIAESGDQLIQLVLNKRIEMGIGNTMVVTYLANKINAADKIKFLSPPVTESPLYIAFSKKKISADFVARFNKYLQAFKATQAYSAIIANYKE